MTHEITLNTTARLNPPLLTEELKAALGADLRAVQTEPERVRVLLAAAPTTIQEQAARDVLDAHDPSDESATEREKRLRRAKLRALLMTDEPLDPDDFAGEAAIIRKLARKVLLLEARLAALARGIREE